MTKQKQEKTFTNRPAPMLPGLYSLQAIPKDPSGPDVTIYRHDVEEVLSWKGAMTKRGGYDRFLLRHAVDAWEVYGPDGSLECKCADVVGIDDAEPRRPVPVDSALVEAEAAAAVGPGLSCLSRVEGHAGASAAEHSNFCAISRKLLMDADPKDLRHVFLVESKAWPCRVMGLYVNMSAVGTEFQDRFLDRYKWWSRGWPLDNAHHQALFATRLSDVRRDYLGQVLVDALLETGTVETSDAALSAKVAVALATIEVRRNMACKLIPILYSNLLYSGREMPEMFAPDALREHAPAIAQVFYDTIG